MAAWALRELPYVQAGRAYPARIEGIPGVAAGAAPGFVPRRLPVAQRAANARASYSLSPVNIDFRDHLRHGSVDENPGVRVAGKRFPGVDGHKR
jgi:hypothetical protein